MVSKVHVVFLLIVLCSVNSSSQTHEWLEKVKSIKLLKADRSDIVRLYGEPPGSQGAYDFIYRVSEGKLDFELSRGRCSANEQHRWDVREFIVTRIFFTPSIQLKPEQLGVDLRNFKKVPSTDVEGAYDLESSKRGMGISVRSNGLIEMVEFYPAKRLDKFRCKNTQAAT